MNRHERKLIHDELKQLLVQQKAKSLNTLNTIPNKFLLIVKKFVLKFNFDFL